MTESLVIRPATSADRLRLRQAIIALQDYEQALHATRLPGEQIADRYLDRMLHKAETEGAVLVAESNGIFIGFAAGWIITARGACRRGVLDKDGMGFGASL